MDEQIEGPVEPLLLNVVQDLALVRDRAGVVEVVKRAARQLTKADGVTFVLRDGDSCHYVDEDAVAPLWKGKRFPATSCISGWAMLHREVVVIEDIYSDDRIPHDAYRPTFVKSLAMVPVRSQDPIAAIGAYWATEHRATPRELQHLQVLADTTAVAIDNVQLFEALQQRAHESRRLLDQYKEEVAKREQIEEQLHRSQKLEAIGRLAGGVAHDFNNLLTVISGYAEIGAMDVEDSTSGAEAFEQIKLASERAAALTHQLLAFSRHQVLDPRVIQLNAVVRNMDKMIRRLIGTDIDVRTLLEPRLGNVLVDTGRVEQVLLNLVVNARDAMPSGGKLTIETANVELTSDASTRHGDVIPGRYVLVAVSDSGHGMDHDTAQRLFEPFFTTKPKGKGTGLGLSTVYGIVKQSGGHIGVYSEPGRGATFKVYLPRVDLPVEPTAAHARHLDPNLLKGKCVLLVEDEPTLLPLLQDRLLALGCDVLVAAHGEQALALSDKHVGAIDLVVTDLVMPGMSGAELGVQIAKQRPEARILYISGYTEAAAIHQGSMVPGMTYLQKPFTPSAFAAKLVEVLSR